MLSTFIRCFCSLTRIKKSPPEGRQATHTPHPQPRNRDRSTGRRNSRRADRPRPPRTTTPTAHRPAANHRRQPRGNTGRTDDRTRRTTRRAARNRHSRRAAAARDEHPTRRRANTRRDGPHDNAKKTTTTRQAGDDAGNPEDQTDTKATRHTPRQDTSQTRRSRTTRTAHLSPLRGIRQTQGRRRRPRSKTQATPNDLNDKAFAPRFCKRIAATCATSRLAFCRGPRAIMVAPCVCLPNYRGTAIPAAVPAPTPRREARRMPESRFAKKKTPLWTSRGNRLWSRGCRFMVNHIIY